MQQLRVLGREAIKTRTTETILALDDEAKRHGQFAKGLLIRLDCCQTCNQIAFAVCRTACVKLSVLDRGCEWPRSPFSQLTDRLHIVVPVNNKRLWTTTTLAVDDRITGADTKRARAHADSLHRLLDRFRNRAHARATRGHGRHTAKLLQALRKTACVPVYITIKFRKTQTVLSVASVRFEQNVSGVLVASLKPGANQFIRKGPLKFLPYTRLLITRVLRITLHDCVPIGWYGDR